MKDFKFKINGTEYAASVEEQDDNMVQVTVNGNTYSVEVEHEAPKAAPMALTPEKELQQASCAPGKESWQMKASSSSPLIQF